MPLLYVLWIAALLSIIASSLLSSTTSSYHLARNQIDNARWNARTEAAVNRAVLALVDGQYDHRWRVDGVPYDFTFDGTTMQISIQDETGRIDLNRADRPLLLRLFTSANLDTQAADQFVDKIFDWRDQSPLKRLHGAKDAEYRSAGLGYAPRNGPFQSVDELKLVLGMTPELFARIEPALTVYSDRQLFDPKFAPREALLAWPTAVGNEPNSAMSARMRGSDAHTRLGARAGVITPTVSLAGRAFTISIVLQEDNRRLARDVVVRLTDDPHRPYWVLNWKDR